jgi:hypothetical protein
VSEPIRRAHVALLIAGGACATALLSVAMLVSGPATAGCYTHECDPISVTYSRGEMVDDTHYETSPILEPDSGVGSGEPWIQYPPNVTLRITYPDAAAAIIADRAPLFISSALGITDQPDIPDSSFIPDPASLTEITGTTRDGFTVFNNSCAGYFARFVVEFPAFPPDAAATGTDAPND